MIQYLTVDSLSSWMCVKTRCTSVAANCLSSLPHRLIELWNGLQQAAQLLQAVFTSLSFPRPFEVYHSNYGIRIQTCRTISIAHAFPASSIIPSQPSRRSLRLEQQQHQAQPTSTSSLLSSYAAGQHSTSRRSSTCAYTR